MIESNLYIGRVLAFDEVTRDVEVLIPALQGQTPLRAQVYLNNPAELENVLPVPTGDKVLVFFDGGDINSQAYWMLIQAGQITASKILIGTIGSDQLDPTLQTDIANSEDAVARAAAAAAQAAADAAQAVADDAAADASVSAADAAAAQDAANAAALLAAGKITGPEVDENITTIDGGLIQTGQVDTARLNAAEIRTAILTVSKIVAADILAGTITTTELDTNAIQSLTPAYSYTSGPYSDAGSKFDLATGDIITPSFSVIGGTASFSGAVSGGTIHIGGNDNTSFHVDASGNMWLGSGDAGYNSAPFKVSSTGSMVATSGSITGSITATQFVLAATGGGWISRLEAETASYFVGATRVWTHSLLFNHITWGIDVNDSAGLTWDDYGYVSLMGVDNVGTHRGFWADSMEVRMTAGSTYIGFEDSGNITMSKTLNVAGAVDASGNVSAGICTIASNGVITGVNEINATDGSATDPSFTFTADTNTGMYRSGTDQVAFATGGGMRMRVSNGGVSVNRVQPLSGDMYIDANGGLVRIQDWVLPSMGAGTGGNYVIRKTDGVLAYQSSKRALKEQIEYLPETLASSAIDDLQPVSFIWKDFYGNPNEESERFRKADLQYGFIAEDVAAVAAPLAIWGLDEDEEGEQTGGMSPINWDVRPVVALVVKELQSLRKRVRELESAGRAQ